MALMSVCACLTSMAEVNGVNPATQVMSESAMTGNRICLLHLYDWDEAPNGTRTIQESDPFYYGGWSTQMVTGQQAGYLVAQGGMTMYEVDQPLRIDYQAGTVTLEVSDAPFATVAGSTTTVADGVTTTVDSTQYYYIVNEDWLLNNGELNDVQGQIMDNGSIHIKAGFAYYIETVKKTTITSRTGDVREFTDETVAISKVFRDTWLLAPNGIHEYTQDWDGALKQTDVYIYQDGDNVYVYNLYGYGAPEAVLELQAGGKMNYPSQALRDIPASASPDGDGMWYNATVTDGNIVAGNEGDATTTVITWGQTTPWDHARTWDGWSNNKLYYTSGAEFVLPAGPEPQFALGDVNHDGEVDVSDVTLLITYVLNGTAEGFFDDVADVDGAEGIDVGDVTALIGSVLG